MLKNKFLILIVITLFVFGFLCGSVYATEETGTDNEYGFIYTAQDGTVYNLPVYPEELKEYNHYVVIRTTIWEEFYLIPFNETFEVIDNGASRFNILVDGENFSKFYWNCRFAEGTPDLWTASGSSLGGSEFYFSKTNNPHYIVDSCTCFSSYQNNLQDSIDNNDSFFLNRNQVLAPIVEKTPLEMVLQEIVEILPVVLVVIVALIAMRKAIAFLTQILRQS